MNRSFCFAIASVCAAWLILLAALPAVAQRPRVPFTRLAVDVAEIDGGPQLLGAIIKQDASGVTIAVERAWLRDTYLKFYETRLAAEQQAAKAGEQQLRERINAWRERRAADEEIIFFLERELERLDKQDAPAADAAPPAEPQFMLVDIAADEVERVFRQPPERRQVALLAWRERIRDVSTRTSSALRRELEEKGIDDFMQTVDLAERLPPTFDDDRQWAARVAIVEHQMRGKRHEYQGSGDFLARTDSAAAAPDMSSLLSGLLGGQLSKNLAELLGGGAAAEPRNEKPNWLAKVSAAADAEEISGVKVTRVENDLARRVVTVDLQFVAKMPDGEWIPIYSLQETSDASKDRPELTNLIEKDQRIAGALETLKALGLGAGDEQVRQALRFGAAVMEAQENADVKFHKFKQQYSRRLDQPPVFLPPASEK